MALKATIKKQLPKSKDKILDVLKELSDFLKLHFFEREDVVRQIILSVLTRQHLLLYGDAGTAKSAIIRALLTAFTSAKFFKNQCTKYQPEEILVGPLNPKKLREEGLYEHNTDGTLVDAHFAFLDEIFDSNDSTLRSMLEILNERTFTKGHQRKKCPLISAFMSSNFIRTEKNIQAFIDRIIFKAEVKPLREKKHRLGMFKNYLDEGDLPKFQGEKLTLADLTLAWELIDKVTIPDDVLELYITILNELKTQASVVTTDRKSNFMLRVVRASAFLKGRTKADPSDLKALRYCSILIGNSNEETLFDGIFAKFIESISLVQKAFDELEKEVDEAVSKMKGLKRATTQHIEQLREINTKIEKFRDEHLSNIGDDDHRKSVGKKLDKFSDKLGKVVDHLDQIIG